MTPDTRCHACTARQGAACPAVGPLPASRLVRHGGSLAPAGCPLPPPVPVPPRQCCGVDERPCWMATCRMALPDGECALDYADAGPMLLRDIGRVFGVTMQAIQATERKALAKLEAAAEAAGLRDGFETTEDAA